MSVTIYIADIAKHVQAVDTRPFLSSHAPWVWGYTKPLPLGIKINVWNLHEQNFMIVFAPNTFYFNWLNLRWRLTLLSVLVQSSLLS